MIAWLIVGWIGNGLYFTRFLLQWISSERSRRSVTPRSFWWLSLGGCLCLGAYVVQSGEFLLLPAYLVNGVIYARNVWVDMHGAGRARIGTERATVLGLVATVLLLGAAIAAPRTGSAGNVGWVLAALGGQAIWSTRFLLQWWYAEHTGRSHFPAAFWWYSLAGSGFNIAYTAHLGDVTLLASYVLTPLYPIRNLMLERRRRD